MFGSRSSLRRSLSVAALAFTGLAQLGCSSDKAPPGDYPRDASNADASNTDASNTDASNTDAGTTPGSDLQISPGDDGGNKFDSDASQTCVVTKTKTTSLPPNVLIVLDRSGSMNDKIDGTACMNGCGVNSKWTQMTQALEAFLPTVNKVSWGLKLFATPNQDNCAVGNGAEVEPALNNAAAIMTAIGAYTAGSSTPTTAAINSAAAYLKTLDDRIPKFILLVTDGSPTCGKSQCAAGVNTGGDPTACDDANAINAVKAVYDTMQIPTFVVGIGTSTGGSDATLISMARAGGYPRNVTASSPAYYPVGSTADLTKTFQIITGMARSCIFAIDPPIDPEMQTVSGVNANGVPLGTADFTVIGTTVVRLNGKACTDFTAGILKTIEVQVMCSI